MITVPAWLSATLDMIPAEPMNIIHGNVSFSSWTCDWQGWGSVGEVSRSPYLRKYQT